MKFLLKKKQLHAVLYAIFVSSCVAPRVISNSGKVTPKGNFSAGYHTSYNISTQSGVYLKDIIVDNVSDLAKKDSITIDENFIKINKAAVAYQLDPVSAGNEFYLKYGIYKRWDIGAKLAGNAKVLETQFQFMGPTGNIEDKTTQKTYGSIGLQFSTQSQSLPSVLSYVQDRMGYSFKRKDFLIPVLFSYSIGNEEEFGALSGGLAICYSIVNYSATPVDIYNLKKTELEPQNYQQKYFSYGFFMNAKLGYKNVYLIPSLSMFYQNYGTYQLLDGSSANFKGLTIIPGLGIKFRFGRNTYEKKSN
ncbi:MAG TPA: hypothetical protein PK323_06030 [Bacteroidia bacterium]|nr:hypothetical protein [Bacteroidia bacterium]